MSKIDKLRKRSFGFAGPYKVSYGRVITPPTMDFGRKRSVKKREKPKVKKAKSSITIPVVARNREKAIRRALKSSGLRSSDATVYASLIKRKVSHGGRTYVDGRDKANPRKNKVYNVKVIPEPRKRWYQY